MNKNTEYTPGSGNYRCQAGQQNPFRFGNGSGLEMSLFSTWSQKLTFQDLPRAFTRFLVI